MRSNAAFIVFLLAVAFAWWFWEGKEQPQDSIPVDSATPSSGNPSRGEFTLRSEPATASTVMPSEVEPMEAAPVSNEDCRKELLDIAIKLAEHDEQRFADVSITNDDFVETYRGVSRQELESLAVQGDADAMLMLGIVSLLAALGVDDRHAVAVIKSDAYVEDLDFDIDVFADMDKTVIDSAMAWWTEAALHGRLQALQGVGTLYSSNGNGPVELGWISQEEFEQLPQHLRNKNVVDRVFTAAMVQVHPEMLRSSELSYAEWSSLQEQDLAIYWETAVQPLVRDFRQQLAERNLSLPDIEPRKTTGELLAERGSDCRPELAEFGPQ